MLHTDPLVLLMVHHCQSSLSHATVIKAARNDSTLLAELAKNKSISKGTWEYLFSELKLKNRLPLVEHDLDEKQIWMILNTKYNPLRERFLLNGAVLPELLVQQIARLGWVDPPLAQAWADRVAHANVHSKASNAHLQQLVEKRSQLYFRYLGVTSLKPQWVNDSRFKRIRAAASEYRPLSFELEPDADDLVTAAQKQLDPLGTKAWELFFSMLPGWSGNAYNLFDVIRLLQQQ